MGDTDVCPWDMGTFGSRSIPDAAQHLRLTGAAARGALLEIASQEFKVDPAEVELIEGKARVKTATGSNVVAYGDLVQNLQRVETVPPSTQPIPPAEWKTARSPSRRRRGRARW